MGRCGRGFREWGKQWTMALVFKNGVEVADWVTSGFQNNLINRAYLT